MLFLASGTSKILPKCRFEERKCAISFQTIWLLRIFTKIFNMKYSMYGHRGYCSATWSFLIQHSLLAKPFEYINEDYF